MVRRQNITEDAFRFIKYRCIYCKKILSGNRLFCNNECRDLYFEKIKDTKIKTWINKSKRQTKLSNILNEENLKAMVKETESSIDKKTNKSKR